MDHVGDYLKRQRQYKPFSVDVDLSVQGQAGTLVVASSASHKIYVQRIVVSIFTHGAPFFSDYPHVLVRDSSANVIFNSTDRPAAVNVPDQVVCDFGPIGTGITTGDSLMYGTNEAATPSVARLHVEGYELLA